MARNSDKGEDLKDKLRFEDTGIYEDKLIEAQTEHFKKVGILIEEKSIAAIQIFEVGLIVNGNNINGEPSWIAPLDKIRFESHHPNYLAIQIPQTFDFW